MLVWLLTHTRPLLATGLGPWQVMTADQLATQQNAMLRTIAFSSRSLKEHLGISMRERENKKMKVKKVTRRNTSLSGNRMRCRTISPTSQEGNRYQLKFHTVGVALLKHLVKLSSTMADTPSSSVDDMSRASLSKSAPVPKSSLILIFSSFLISASSSRETWFMFTLKSPPTPRLSPVSSVSRLDPVRITDLFFAFLPIATAAR
mmetsp:Transcript_261/g.492  ORF Transcript_261/g.492 Transcript_261/m.492 type:complete len:204 (-) Transcript_261:72-683(-)